MANALTELLPALYVKTLPLTKSKLAGLQQDLLNVKTTRYNDQPDINFSTTETTYSSTPSEAQYNQFQIENIADKNLVKSKDATRRVTETSDIIDRFIKMTQMKISGYVNAFVNDPMFSYI
ncbi:UNVERIFIED_CONTAM: hypothetical protein RF648_17530 [Kocuria sp. CPCC 205274]|uniref:Uncharacterized protein n=1 Tax=Herbiconiux daphne TaxID=2970914 RepID=A0ABT2H8Y1_9MICO|nr:hypothetical protein [Herbiconiux daphne]MCS5736400.1 hypothetical protein [Herbiconiux daphne]